MKDEKAVGLLLFAVRPAGESGAANGGLTPLRYYWRVIILLEIHANRPTLGTLMRLRPT